MASPAPAMPEQGPSQPIGPALEKAADDLLALFKHEKSAALSHQAAMISYLNGQLQTLSKEFHDSRVKQATEISEKTHELYLLKQELATVKNYHRSDKARLKQTINSLQQERSRLEDTLSSAKSATEQMGIYNIGSNCFGFAKQWVDLFNEIGIAAGTLWKPEQLLSVISGTTDRLHQYRFASSQPDQPLPAQFTDSFVLQAELTRARAYVARLESEAARSQQE